MTDSPPYTPPKVWTWAKPSGGTFANINRPIAGSTHEKDLPVGYPVARVGCAACDNDQQASIGDEYLRLARQLPRSRHQAAPLLAGIGCRPGSIGRHSSHLSCSARNLSGRW
jgi:hypothetical protein